MYIFVYTVQQCSRVSVQWSVQYISIIKNYEYNTYCRMRIVNSEFFFQFFFPIGLPNVETRLTPLQTPQYSRCLRAQVRR